MIELLSAWRIEEALGVSQHGPLFLAGSIGRKRAMESKVWVEGIALVFCNNLDIPVLFCLRFVWAPLFPAFLGVPFVSILFRDPSLQTYGPTPCENGWFLKRTNRRVSKDRLPH